MPLPVLSAVLHSITPALIGALVSTLILLVDIKGICNTAVTIGPRGVAELHFLFLLLSKLTGFQLGLLNGN